MSKTQINIAEQSFPVLDTSSTGAVELTALSNLKISCDRDKIPPQFHITEAAIMARRFVRFLTHDPDSAPHYYRATLAPRVIMSWHPGETVVHITRYCGLDAIETSSIQTCDMRVVDTFFNFYLV